MSARPDLRFITRKWAPAVGGMETWSFELARALKAHGKIETIALPGRREGRPPSALRLLGWGIFAALRLFISHPARATLIGDMASWPLGWIAHLRGSKRIVIAAHGTDVSYPRRGGLRGNLYGFYLRLGARLLGSAQVSAVSRATRAAALEVGWRHATVIVPATSLRADTPPEGHDGFVLFVGRLIELKGCAWFIREVLPRLPRGTRLLVAGPITDPAEGAVLKAPGVEYLGTLDSAELISAYRRALCLVLPNIEPRTGQFEGFGIVAAEASAVGAVVIAADSGGLSDTISDGQTGLLLPPGKPQAWADAIVNVADWSPKKRAHFTAEAMARASRHFTWDRVARETWALCHVPSERSHEQGRKQAAKLVKSKS